MNQLFPPVEPNENGDILDISQETITSIIDALEVRLNGSFLPEERKLIKGLIHLAYNKCKTEGRNPQTVDLIEAIERAEPTLKGETQIRKFKELKNKLKATNS